MRGSINILGTWLKRIERLQMTVMRLISFGPRSLRWWIWIPSGPAVDEALGFLIQLTSVGMKRRGEGDQVSVLVCEICNWYLCPAPAGGEFSGVC